MRRHAHIDFQLFSQKSNGIPVVRLLLPLVVMAMICVAAKPIRPGQHPGSGTTQGTGIRGGGGGMAANGPAPIKGGSQA